MRHVATIGLLVLALAGQACARSEPQADATPSATPDQAMPTPAPVAWCHAVPLERTFCRALVLDAPKAALRLAVADTEARRERGLMNVAVLPAQQGMLFVFPDEADVERGFWMKDTIAPLDMIFVRVDGTVSAIAANVPATKRNARDADIARRNGIGRYVIELAAGRAHSAGLRVGYHFTIPEIDAR
jgi:uncharacterized membrane protein (UPF0127 family)